MDHSKRNGKRPVIELSIKNVLVVNNDSETEEDPNGNVGVRENDFLENAIGEVRTFSHVLGVGLLVFSS